MGDVITEQNATERQAKQVEHRRELTTVPFETAVHLQHVIVKVIDNGDVAPSALAQLARAWSELEDRKRIIKMKPAPKPIDVTVKPRKQQASSGFSESPAQAKPKRASKVQADQIETPPRATE